MSWLEGSRARLRLLFGRRAAESRMTAEIRFHIDMETERLVREQGLDAIEARRTALVAFMDVSLMKVSRGPFDDISLFSARPALAMIKLVNTALCIL